MITLFQITGSSSFAARAALECAGAEYEVVDVHPRRRDEAPGFADANPLKRVPALRDGDVRLAETAAILLWIGDRFPDAGLAPGVGTAARADHYRWVTWCANTLHVGWWPIMAGFYFTTNESAQQSLEVRGRENMDRHGRHLEAWLADHEWLAGDRPGVSDIYAYMLVGWANYYDDITLGGPAVASHYARVGALPGVVRARELDDLDDRLIRFHPDLRGGKPLD
jgi:glutathione S-transferase